MKQKILYFVVGEYPTPEETAEILKLAEHAEGEPAPNVEVMSVQKMPADHMADLSHVSTLAGAVPTIYRDAANGAEGAPVLHREYVKPLMTPEAVSAPLDQTPTPQVGTEGSAEQGAWVASSTAKPETRKRK